MLAEDRHLPRNGVHLRRDIETAIAVVSRTSYRAATANQEAARAELETAIHSLREALARVIS